MGTQPAGGADGKQPSYFGPWKVAETTAWPGRRSAKGDLAMIYGEPETTRFLAAVERLKQAKQRRVRQTRQAKQRVRATLRKAR